MQRLWGPRVGRLARPAVSARNVVLTGVASHRVPSGMAVLPVRDSEELIEELAEAYVNTSIRRLVEFQQQATRRMGRHLDYEEALLGSMGGGGGGGGAAAVAATTATSSSSAVEEGGGGGAAAAAAAPAASAKKTTERQTFDVVLKEYPAENKVKLIKELRAICALAIPDAKAAVERCPGVIAAGISKDKAEKLKAALSSLGGTVEFV